MQIEETGGLSPEEHETLAGDERFNNNLMSLIRNTCQLGIVVGIRYGLEASNSPLNYTAEEMDIISKKLFHSLMESSIHHLDEEYQELYYSAKMKGVI